MCQKVNVNHKHPSTTNSINEKNCIQGNNCNSKWNRNLILKRNNVSKKTQQFSNDNFNYYEKLNRQSCRLTLCANLVARMRTFYRKSTEKSSVFNLNEQETNSTSKPLR